MDIQAFYPRHQLLKKHIEYYYFLKTDSPDFNSVYYSFPNILQSLNLHRRADYEIKPNFTGIYESRKNEYLTVVQGYYDSPLLVNLKGRLDKITIVFKPLGFNHFICRSFKEVAGDHSQLFTEWEDSDYAQFLEAFYRTDEPDKRINLLENFLLTRYQPFAEAEILQAVLDLLTDFESEHSMTEIAARVRINARTLTRLFDKHFGVSPIALKKNARFRHSLNNKLFNTQFKTLTAIGYESNFYDQSYFVKMYKELTGKNPSRFFDAVKKLADDQLIFEFIHK